MSEHDNDGACGGDTSMNSASAETLNNLHVSDFIKYSDTVDERMMDIAKSWKDPRQSTSNSWDRRGDSVYDELDSDSEEEAIPFSIARQCCTTPNEEQHFDNEVKSSDNVFDKKYAHFRQEDLKKEGMSVNENIPSSSVENLVKKFSAIELLRKKENLRKAHESETSKPSCSAARACQQSAESQKTMNPEVFLGRKRKKHRDTPNERERTSADLDEPLPEEVDDKEIDEIVQLLSSSSLIKDYDENLTFPKEDDEILKTFLKSEEKEGNLSDNTRKRNQNKAADSAHYIFENVQDAESQDTSENQFVDDILDWKGDTSGDLCTIFDGYDIDNPSSFHDWMLDDILSRPLRSSKESEFPLCITCFLCHHSEQACSQD